MIHENNELEGSVIGTIINYPHILINTRSILKVDYLYHLKNKMILKAIYTLLDSNETIDLVSVVVQIKKSGDIIESVYVSQLLNMSVNPDSIESKCRKLHELYMLRELSMVGKLLTQSAEETTADPFVISEKLEAKVTELMNIKNENILSVGDVFVKMITEIREVLDSGLPTGIPTGLSNLDKQTGGWQNGNLIIIAARPGMGKTATALRLAKYPAIENNTPIAIFSLEMTALELVGRLASSEAQISSTLINQKRIDNFQLSILGSNCTKLIDAPIYIDDTPGLTITDLRSKAKKLFYEKGIKMIIIDYLQLMRGENENTRDQEISTISRGLKGLAKELNLPIIALAQLNRECEKRADKRPILSDLRDGGSIEQDADIVSFLFRPEMYKDVFSNGYEYSDRGALPIENLMIFDIAKGRGLRTGEVPLKFFGEFMIIQNYEI